MLDVRIGDIKIGDEERASVMEVLQSEWLSEGPKVRKFESLWAQYVGTGFCVAVNSGSSALLAGLYALLYDKRFGKVRRGSKVITSPVTYVATSNAIVLAGMEPVYVDIDPHTFTLKADQIEDLLKNGEPDEYSIILPVHLMGYPNDMDTINRLAEKYDLVVFEDSSQAHGSLYKGQRTGSLSLLSSYSFYVAHNIQVGEMGATVTRDRKIRSLLRKVKSNGRICSCSLCSRSEGNCPHAEAKFDPRFTHDLIGFNFKTTEFQAAIAIPQIKRAEEIIKARQGNVKYLSEKLSQYSDLLDLPAYSDDISYLAYPMIIKDKTIDREEFMRKLELNGIETRPLFGCIPTQQPAYRHLRQQYEGRLPNADFVGSAGCYVGCHQYLGHKELDLIAAAIGSVIKR